MEDKSDEGVKKSLCCGFEEEKGNCTDIPKTLDELVEKFRRIFSEDKVNVEYVQTIMSRFQSNPKEWKKYAMFDTHRYTRNLVDNGNGKFNMLILCWSEGQGSGIHSHAGSHCFLKVLQGKAREEMYDWPKESSENTEMHPTEVKIFELNQCEYMHDKIGLHRIENPSHTEKLVTLHLYSPPFDMCKTFDQKTSVEQPAQVTLWSKYGKRTNLDEEGSVPSAANAENN